MATTPLTPAAPTCAQWAYPPVLHQRHCTRPAAVLLDCQQYRYADDTRLTSVERWVCSDCARVLQAMRRPSNYCLGDNTYWTCQPLGWRRQDRQDLKGGVQP